MFFLLKSAFWLLIVFLMMPWPEPSPPQASAVQKASAKVPSAKSRAPAPHRDRDVLSSFTDAAHDKLIEAAREHCVAHPRECLSALGVDLTPEKSRR